MMNPEGNYTKLVSSHHRFYAAGSDSIYNINGEKNVFLKMIVLTVFGFSMFQVKDQSSDE